MSRNPKKSKFGKVRRFSYMYDSPRSTSSIVLRTLLSITMVFVLAFIGWNAYGPIRDYFSGALAAVSHLKEINPASSSVSASASSPSNAEETPASSQPEVPPEPEKPAELRAAYIPIAVLSNFDALDTALAQLEGSEINAVLFDLKDASGAVYYQSSSDLVAQAQSQSAQAVDLREICRLLEERGLTPMGRLCAFADPQASARLSDATVKYMYTNMQWLDNSVENGGKGWLNPYSSQALEYLRTLVTEAASQGVKRILLEQYSFPTGVGLDFANFGPQAETVSRDSILSSCINTLEQAALENDCQLSLYVSALGALGQQNQFYGEKNPLTFFDDVVIDVSPAQFGDGYTSETLNLEQPVLQPYGTVKTLWGVLDSSLSGKEMTGMIQGYTATGALANNKVYHQEDIAAQIRALNDCGIQNFILYSPGGSYPTD